MNETKLDRLKSTPIERIGELQPGIFVVWSMGMYGDRSTHVERFDSLEEAEGWIAGIDPQAYSEDLEIHAAMTVKAVAIPKPAHVVTRFTIKDK